MAVLYSIALYVFHALYALSEIILLLRSWLSFWLDSDRFLRPRANLPDHLAVAFTSKRTSARGKGGEQAIWDDEEAVDMMVKNAWSVIEWCKIVGIPQVTLYDRDGQSSKPSPCTL
jgi:undecaprenyl pyrophosphate synthase